MLLAALGLYGLNLLVGLAARLGRARFGRLHHVLYAAVALATGAAWWVTRAPGLLLTLAALALLPLPSARSPLHPTLAGLGLLGYLSALTSERPWS